MTCKWEWFSFNGSSPYHRKSLWDHKGDVMCGHRHQTDIQREHTSYRGNTTMGIVIMYDFKGRRMNYRRQTFDLHDITFKQGSKFISKTSHSDSEQLRQNWARLCHNLNLINMAMKMAHIGKKLCGIVALWEYPPTQGDYQQIWWRLPGLQLCPIYGRNSTGTPVHCYRWCRDSPHFFSTNLSPCDGSKAEDWENIVCTGKNEKLQQFESWCSHNSGNTQPATALILIISRIAGNSLLIPEEMQSIYKVLGSWPRGNNIRWHWIMRMRNYYQYRLTIRHWQWSKAFLV